MAETTRDCCISADTAVSYGRAEDESALEDEKKELSPPDDVGKRIASVLLGEIEQGGVVDSNHQVCVTTSLSLNDLTSSGLANSGCYL